MNSQKVYELKSLFLALTEKTQALVKSLRDPGDDSFIWLDLEAEQRIDILDPLDRLIFVLELYTLHPQQKPKTVLMCPGFVAASPLVYQKFVEMNTARRAFQEHMVSLRKEILGIKDSTLDNQFGNPTHERPKIIHDLLEDLDLGHLHFKHVYRCAPLLEHPPTQIGWTWALTQSIKRLTPDQVRTLLEKKHRDHPDHPDFQKLSRLSSQVQFSIRQELAPHLRINCLQHNGSRKMLKGTLPVVFPKGLQMPQIRPAKKLEERLMKQDQEEKTSYRKDRTIGQHPFFSSIRVFIDKEEEQRYRKIFGD